MTFLNSHLDKDLVSCFSPLGRSADFESGTQTSFMALTVLLPSGQLLDFGLVMVVQAARLLLPLSFFLIGVQVV